MVGRVAVEVLAAMHDHEKQMMRLGLATPSSAARKCFITTVHPCTAVKPEHTSKFSGLEL